MALDIGTVSTHKPVSHLPNPQSLFRTSPCVYSASIPPSPAPLPWPPAQPLRRTYRAVWSIFTNELAAWACVGVQVT